jgi:hypothetical protein
MLEKFGLRNLSWETLATQSFPGNFGPWKIWAIPAHHRASRCGVAWLIVVFMSKSDRGSRSRQVSVVLPLAVYAALKLEAARAERTVSAYAAIALRGALEKRGAAEAGR